MVESNAITMRDCLSLIQAHVEQLPPLEAMVSLQVLLQEINHYSLSLCKGVIIPMANKRNIDALFATPPTRSEIITPDTKIVLATV